MHTNELTEIQIQHFQEKGWVGLLDTFSRTEVEPVKEYLKLNAQTMEIGAQKVLEFYNPYLGKRTMVDHHLSCKSLARLFAHDKVTRRLNQLDEPNLLLWKSAIFHRMPGQESIGWHQAIEYYGVDVDESNRELIFPDNENILNLTVWLAIEDVTPEKGCLHFANGSHKQRFKSIYVPFGKGSFPEEKYQKSSTDKQKKSKLYIFDEEEWEIESVSVKAGQIVIFTERVMHTSPPNYSSQERIAINARYIRPSVTVYPNRLNSNYLYDKDTIEKHFCILVSGRDDLGINVVKNKVEFIGYD